MADSGVNITEGSGQVIDTRTEATNGNHRQVVVLGDPSTNAGVAPVDATAGLKVDLGADNDVTVTGDALTSLQLIDDAIKTDDAAFTPATDKVMMIGAQLDNTGTDSVDEGDAGAVRMSANRNLYMQIRDAAGNERGANVDASNRLQTVTTAAGNETTTKEVVGDAAEDAALAGNPVRMGGRASAAEPTAMSADNDVVTQWLDRRGRAVVTMQAATATTTSVNDAATSTSLLASNTSRKGAIITNDSTAILYVKLGSTASTTSYAYKLYPDDTVEIPFGYTGAIDGIWASDASGAARITEIS